MANQDISYGIYNTVSKKYCFGIQEPSKSKALRKLYDKIGKDTYKWRFEIRKIKNRKGEENG
ncbi:hypothetical protein MAWWA_121 [Bacillus phage vB_BspH_Mawwa]|nr:hypothetical protein MAWWA_121 [Bacillus phage vB_BspH_Mawwa]